MPTYDYVCDACDHAFEQWQSFHDDHLSTCPKCKKKKLRRLIGTGAAVVFKGSGFYETDYNRGADYQEKAKADSDAAKPADTKPAEAKPADTSTPAADSTSATNSDKKSDGDGKGKKGRK
jgi:putative FmdB family regulatory protein